MQKHFVGEKPASNPSAKSQQNAAFRPHENFSRKRCILVEIHDQLGDY